MNFNRINELQRLLKKDAIDKIPKDFFTMEQYAKHEGITVRRASQRVKEVMQKYPSSVEIKKFRISVGQVVRPVPHYRIK